MDSLLTALIAAATGLAGFWLQSQLKKGEDFEVWFRDYYLDNGFNLVIVHLYSLRVSGEHIWEDPDRRRAMPSLPMEALLRVSSLCDFPLLFDMITVGDRILRYRQDPDLRSRHSILLQNIAPTLVAVQQNLVSEPPTRRKQLRGLRSRRSIQELHRKLRNPVEQFQILREIELDDACKRYDAQREALLKIAHETRRAKSEGKVPSEDEKVKEAMAKAEELQLRHDQEMGRITED